MRPRPSASSAYMVTRETASTNSRRKVGAQKKDRLDMKSSRSRSFADSLSLWAGSGP